MYAAAVEYDKELVDRAIAALKAQFPRDIERIVYSAGKDWAEEPALFFRVLLDDRENPPFQLQSPPEKFLMLYSKIMDDIRAAVHAYRTEPYFSFRGVSEQERLRDPEWN